MAVTHSRLQPGIAPPRGSVPAITPEQLADARAALRMRFLVVAPRRVAALREALQNAPGSAVARGDLVRLGHQLRGTAATVGLPDLGMLGGLIERVAALDPFTAEHHARATAAVDLVEECVVRAIADQGTALADDPRFLALVPGAR
jgi:HPt (histidine-containing phosphotransfer) domain-containing protein